MSAYRMPLLLALASALSGAGSLTASTHPSLLATPAGSALHLFRISDMGPPSNPDFDAWAPAIAYNPVADEYLVVWQGNDAGINQIYGQRIDAATGAEVGTNDFQISEMLRGATGPQVSFDALQNQYLVAWTGDNYPVYTASQIYGQRLTAAGADIGVDFQIAGGPTAPVPYVCEFYFTCYFQPHQYAHALTEVTYNATSGEQVVTFTSSSPFNWPGERNAIYYNYVFEAERLLGSASAGEFTITHASALSGTPGCSRTCAFGGRSLAYNPTANEYLALWYSAGDLHAARLDAVGAAIGSPFQVTEMSGDARSGHGIYNASANEYLVVWEGLHDTLPAGAPQVFGQRVSAAGEQVGPNDFRISSGFESPSGETPSVAYDAGPGEYLVVWSSTLESGRALFVQRLSTTAEAIGADDIRLTANQTDVSPPALALDATRHRYLVVTATDASPLATNEFEIFGTFYGAPEPFVIGLGQPGGGEVRTWGADPSTSFAQGQVVTLPWPEYNTQNGETHPALGDLDGDGLDEVVVGLGVGGQGRMAIFDDASHGYAFLQWVQLSWSTYNAANGTIWPTVGDIDGDGRDEIIAGFGQGGAGYFAVVDDALTNFSFMYWRRVGWPAYSDTQSGESHPAILNLDDDAAGEIVIGLGPGGQGWIELFDDVSTNMAYLGWVRVGWTDYNQGPGATFPAAGDLDGNGDDELVVGLGPGSQGWVEIFARAFEGGLVHQTWLQVTWPSYAMAVGETHPAVGDVDGDRPAEIVLGLASYPGAGGYFEVRDDASGGYATLRWLNVLRAETSSAGGATFPAIGR